MQEYWADEENKKIIAYDFGFITYTLLGKEAYVGDVYVDPAERRKGIQSYRLLRDVEQVARRAGCKTLTANTHFDGKRRARFTRNVRMMIGAGFEVWNMEPGYITWLKTLGD